MSGNVRSVHVPGARVFAVRCPCTKSPRGPDLPLHRDTPSCVAPLSPLGRSWLAALPLQQMSTTLIAAMSTSVSNVTAGCTVPAASMAMQWYIVHRCAMQTTTPIHGIHQHHVAYVACMQTHSIS
eukprot:363948-Chlamydomonas_euryale.AAC.9